MNNDEFKPENFNFWPVYSDLAIVLVLVLTLLSMGLMVLVTDLYALVPTSVLDAQSRVRSAVEPLKGVSVCQEHGSNQTIVLSSDAVFGSGESSIDHMKPDGLKVVEKLGEILAGLKGDYQRIQVEGHASYESPKIRGVAGDGKEKEQLYGMLNWKLSAERAGAVMQVFIKEGVPDYKISAAARGHYHPVVGDPCNLSINSEDYKRYNNSEKQRQQNRRINILIMYGNEGATE